jgi:hypothetical protein
MRVYLPWQIDEVINAMIDEQSEVQRLTEELREEKERASAAEDRALQQLAHAEATRRVSQPSCPDVSCLSCASL